jgi:hypothetical protein
MMQAQQHEILQLAELEFLDIAAKAARGREATRTARLTPLASAKTLASLDRIRNELDVILDDLTHKPPPVSPSQSTARDNRVSPCRRSGAGPKAEAPTVTSQC